MTDKKAQLLYVEDDENLAFVTSDNLEMAGYKVVHCKNGLEALNTFSTQHFDLCILDVMLPELDGFELAKSIRGRDSQVPIIFLSAKSLREDKIMGLKLGADDYITKPFSIEELTLKINVFLKRSLQLPVAHSEIYSLGPIVFNFSNLSLSEQDKVTFITMKEAELLRLFCTHPNKILKRQEILKSIWGDDDYFMGRSMDVFISRIRKHLKGKDEVRLENIHNVGFKLFIRE